MLSYSACTNFPVKHAISCEESRVGFLLQQTNKNKRDDMFGLGTSLTFLKVSFCGSKAGHTDNTRICLSVSITFKMYINYVRKANGDYRPHEVMVLITKLSLS